jgi:predicted RNA-binding protein with TRAM domain
VNNYSEILFVDSVYNSNYIISGIGGTTFTISLSKKPEKLTYTQNECDKLQYTTTSLSAKGSIDKINIISGGAGYKKLPTFVGSNSIRGKDAYITPKSISIGNAKEVRIINEGFQYSSDKTLQPNASISPLITIKNSNTIGIVTVTNGGNGYTDAPFVVIVNSITREKIDSGILEAKLSGNSVDSISIVQQPKGLPETTVQLFTTNNTNGISIQQVQSSSSGIFTCFITTPTLGFSTAPFSSGDKVFVEGIQKYGSEGTGFNSEDYGYQFFTVDNYNNAGVLDSVTIDISELTTNTGIAKTIQDSIGNIIKSIDYPSFNVTQIQSQFIVGEKLISNNIERDLKISSYENSFIKVSGTYELSVGEIIVGKESGNIATIDKIESGTGRFKVDYSVEKNIGWSNDIGKLDQDNQVIPDNDYYQNLSYSIKSPITYQELRTPVNSLLHTSGLKNFSDTGITSTTNFGAINSENATTIIYDIIEENRVDTIYDFDLVKDIDVVANSSKFLKLKNKKLTDYIECRSNVVLKIDTINRQFSDAEGNPSQFVNLLELNSTVSYDNILVRVSSLDNTEIQLTELVLLNDGSNSFLAEKSTIVNTGVGLTHISGEPIGEFILITDDADDNTYLRFIPSNPFDIDYDIKIINTNFNPTLSGIGTISIGFINLTGSNRTASTGIQTSIISVESNKFSSLYSNIQIIDSVTNQMNFAEVYLNHNKDINSLSTTINSTVGIGSTVIFVADTTGLIVGVSSISVVGAAITNRPIVAVGSTFVQIGAASTSPSIIGIGTVVNFNTTINNTYISEYYFDSEFSSNYYSGNNIGIFTASISPSGILSLNYINNSSNPVNIKSKVVGFGTTSVGTGVYRFISPGQIPGNERSAVYQSTYSSTVSSASTIISLDKSNFNAVKSLVEVSVGSTSALHQIMLVQDQTNIYVQQSPFLSVGSTNGIGTFGGEYSGSNFILKFYPDPLVTSEVNILAFNQCLYTTLDTQNTAPILSYGNVEESIDIGVYNAINGSRINRTDFNLNSNGIQIFAKTFNPTNSTILNPSTGVFNIQNHFFSNLEELIYTPKSTFIGVGASAVGIGSTLNSVGVVTTILPSEVYVIKLSDDAFKLSTRKDYAVLGIGVTFTSYGSGNAHQLEMDKKLEKSLITIDNVVQYPLLFTPISYTLLGNGGQISVGSSIFSLSGISTIAPKDILKIDNEYMGVVNVGLGTTNIGPISNSGNINLVEVTRGFVGSSATTHTDTTSVRIYKGSYNIVDSNIFFAESPRGNPQIERDSSNLTFETSDFTGRVFLRNDYTSNQLYDDISNQFTGIGRTFTLTVGGGNTVGLGTSGGNGILFINGVFQTPTTINNPQNNFSIIENTVSGISSVIFSGVRNPDNLNIITSEFDINQNQTPRGGIIISLGSSTGLGYAPLVGAAVTAVVGAGGSIVSVGLGTTDNLGSGYNGIVSIGVSVYQSGHIGDTAIITASVGAGGTLSFNIGVGGTGYVNPKIFVSEPSYENLNVTGVSRLGVGSTTTTGIGLLLNVEVGASSTTGIGSTYFEVSRFSISRQGYSFRRGDVFKPVGLVTAKGLASPLSEFRLTVVDTFSDSFAAWQFGEFDYIDSIKNYQDGVRTRFPLFYNNELLSFESLEGSQVNLSNALLIVINGVIQDPEVAYEFDGGTSFVFTTAPRPEDNVAIFFYKGTDGDDVFVNDTINETLKRGDTVQVLKNNSIPGTITQDKRTIFDLSFSDKFETNLYSNQGVDSENNKPLSWIKQKVDRKINGENVYKTRDSIESLIYPTAKIIKDFSTTDNQIFVDNAEFFEYDNPEPFSALIVNGISTTTSGAVELISNINVANVNGFSGIITGIGTTVGSGGNPLALRFHLNSPSFAGLSTGYPIYIFDTRVGGGVTSIDTSNSAVVGIGTTFADNVYYIHQLSTIGSVGIITCNILSTTSTIGLSSSGNVSNPVGKFSWGRMSEFTRSSSPISIGVTGNIVDVGLTTFATIQRRGIGIRQTGALPKLL